jgi:crossover junction endodeoxyribonuclease RuvC
VSIEDLYFGKNVGSALAVGHARGVAMLAAAAGSLPCFAYTPQQIKASVCGSGRAAKDQVAAMVQRLLSLPHLPTPDHAADALAVAICHAAQIPALAGSR